MSDVLIIIFSLVIFGLIYLIGFAFFWALIEKLYKRISIEKDDIGHYAMVWPILFIPGLVYGLFYALREFFRDLLKIINEEQKDV